MAFDDYGTAARFRDLVERIATRTIERVRPRIQYATVQSFDLSTHTAVVRYNGETEDITLPFGLAVPSFIGQVVRVDGPHGDRYISDVMGGGGLLERVYSVGALYFSAVDADPALLLGFGVWEEFAAGRTLFGVDVGDPDFDVAEEKGGSKLHSHPLSNSGQAKIEITSSGNILGQRAATASWNPNERTDATHNPTAPSGRTVGMGLAGNTNSTAYFPPYVTVFIWKRIA